MTPHIYFNTDPLIRDKPDKKHDPIKVYIKTQPGESNIKSVLLYILIFNTSSSE